MSEQIKVLEIHLTTFGLIGLLEFPNKSFPKTGMILENKQGHRWKIIGIGTNKKFRLMDRFKQLGNADQCWDCILDSLSHNFDLTVNDILIEPAK